MCEGLCVPRPDMFLFCIHFGVFLFSGAFLRHTDRQTDRHTDSRRWMFSVLCGEWDEGKALIYHPRAGSTCRELSSCFHVIDLKNGENRPLVTGEPVDFEK